MVSDVLELTGVYRGVVTSTDDPADQLRIRAKVPQVFGDDDTAWALPALSVGMTQTPKVNDRVWVMFEAGDPQYPVYLGSWVKSGTPVLEQGDVPIITFPIPGSDITSGTITSTQLGSGSVGTTQLQPDSVTGAQIADFAISVTMYNDSAHHFDPPVLTSNSPSSGFISWLGFTMVYKGISYTIAAGNTNQPYVYWTFGSTTLSTSATLPALTVNDCLLFLNKSGTAFNAQTTQAIDGSLLVTGSIGTNQLAANSITATQISAGAINGQTISAATFTGGTITGNTISGGTISGTTISGTTINGGTISGATIIGSTIETAASGTRMVIVGSGSTTYTEFYAGITGETPGYIQGGSSPVGTSSVPVVVMGSGAPPSSSGIISYVQLLGQSLDLTTELPKATLGAEGGSGTGAVTSTVTVQGAPNLTSGAGIDLQVKATGSGPVEFTMSPILGQFAGTFFNFADGLQIGGSTTFYGMGAGTYNATTDGSAYLVVNHGLVFTPVHIFVQSSVPSGGTAQGYPVVTAITASSFTIRYMPSAGVSMASQNVQGHWLALG